MLLILKSEEVSLSIIQPNSYLTFCFFEKDVVSHNKKMKSKKNKASKDDPTAGDRLGIKGLSKGKRRKLEAYQHLFYLLQVWKMCLFSFPLAQFVI